MRAKIARAFLILSCAASLTYSRAADELKPDDAQLLETVRSRKAADKATTAPVAMPDPLSGLCREPSPKQKNQTASNPHLHTWIDVYTVNAGSAAFKDAEKALPAGTIVIKEKRHLDLVYQLEDKPKVSAEKSKVELFTVMLKREAGFNPDGGDWEYAVVNGDASRVLARGKIESCMECHRIKAKTDFLYRSYTKKAPVDNTGGR